MTKRVLILCTGNSCRSQMAEAIWNHEAAGRWQAFSAGSNPAGYVHPQAIEAAAEIGLEIGGHTSKHVNQFQEQPFDLVVTVCDGAQQACPTLPGAARAVHWPFDDPAKADGDAEQKMQCFRRVRDEIQQTIRDFLQEAREA